MNTSLWIGVVTYGPPERAWMNARGHYLHNAPPGALFAVGVYGQGTDLVGGPCAVGPMLGLCVIGRPVARMLPQDGSMGEVVRMYLEPGLPHGTASAVLRAAADVARRRGIRVLIAYHDRSRHSGCIYRKAGFKKDRATTASASWKGWGTRDRPRSADVGATSKRRWRLELT